MIWALLVKEGDVGVNKSGYYELINSIDSTIARVRCSGE